MKLRQAGHRDQTKEVALLYEDTQSLWMVPYPHSRGIWYMCSAVEPHERKEMGLPCCHHCLGKEKQHVQPVGL